MESDITTHFLEMRYSTECDFGQIFLDEKCLIEEASYSNYHAIVTALRTLQISFKAESNDWLWDDVKSKWLEKIK